MKGWGGSAVAPERYKDLLDTSVHMHPTTFMFVLHIKNYRNTGLVHQKKQKQPQERKVRAGRTHIVKKGELNKWGKRRKTLEGKERWILGGRVRSRRIILAGKGKNMNSDKKNTGESTPK